MKNGEHFQKNIFSYFPANVHFGKQFPLRPIFNTF